MSPIRHISLVGILLLLSASLLVSGQRTAKRQRSGAVEQPDCGEQRKAEVGKCMIKGQILGDEDIVAPTNADELRDLCGNMKESLRCGYSYVKQCLRGVPLQIATLLMNGAKTVYRTRCLSRTDRKDFVTNLACLRNQSMAAPIHQCMTAEALKLNYVATVQGQNPDYYIPGMCCTVDQMVKCVMKQTKQRCAGLTPDAAETADYYADIISDTTRDAMEVFCGKFQNPDTCAAELKPFMAAYADFDDKVKSGNYTPLDSGNALVLPILDILQRPDF